MGLVYQRIIDVLSYGKDKNTSTIIAEAFFAEAFQKILLAQKHENFIKSLEALTYLNQLRQHLEQFTVFLNEISDEAVKNQMAIKTNAIVVGILELKTDAKYSLVLSALDTYKEEMSAQLLKLIDSESTKKLQIGLVVLLSIIVITLVALTGVGLVAECTGAGFYAGFTVFTQKSSATWAFSIVGASAVTGASGAGYCTYEWSKNRGPNLVNAIVDDLEKIEKLAI